MNGGRLVRLVGSLSPGDQCVLAGLVMIPMLAAAAYFSREPFSLIDGTSMWPAEFIKLLALWLSILLLVRGWSRMEKIGHDIETRLKRGDESGGWGESADIADGDRNILKVWEAYCQQGALAARRQRVRAVTWTWFGLSAVLYLIQMPNIPSSDGLSYWVDICLTWLTFYAFACVFAFASDAIMHCNRLIDQLIALDTEWPEMHGLPGGRGFRRIEADIRREWLETWLIAKRSEDISKTVYYPIYIILLLLAAQSDYFDNFDMPVSLILFASLNILLVLMLSISLRRKAVQARRKSLMTLKDIHAEILTGLHGKWRDAALDKLQFYRDRIETCREGAFLPITEQPWLRALTLMTGGGSSILLLQYLAG